MFSDQFRRHLLSEFPFLPRQTLFARCGCSYFREPRAVVAYDEDGLLLVDVCFLFVVPEDVCRVIAFALHDVYPLELLLFSFFEEQHPGVSRPSRIVWVR